MSKSATAIAFLQAAIFAVAWRMNGHNIPMAFFAAFNVWGVALIALYASLLAGTSRYYGIFDASLTGAVVTMTIAAFMMPNIEWYVPWLFTTVTITTYIGVLANKKIGKNAKEPWWTLMLAISPLGIGTFVGLPLALVLHRKDKVKNRHGK